MPPLRQIPKSGLLIYVTAATMTNFARAADTSGGPISNPATAHELPQITVIGNAPAAGLGLPMNQSRRTCRPPTRKDMQRQQRWILRTI